MKNAGWILFSGLALTACGSQVTQDDGRSVATADQAVSANANGAPNSTILYFVRHNEPIQQFSQTGVTANGGIVLSETCTPNRKCCGQELNPLGLERASRFADWMVDQNFAGGLTHLLATNKIRTVLTLQALATATGLTIQQVPANTAECPVNPPTTAPLVINAIRALPLGSRAVIANHSGTIYNIITGATGVPTTDPVLFPRDSTGAAANYNNVWIISVDGNGNGTLLNHVLLDFNLDNANPLTHRGQWNGGGAFDDEGE